MDVSLENEILFQSIASPNHISCENIKQPEKITYSHKVEDQSVFETKVYLRGQGLGVISLAGNHIFNLANCLVSFRLYFGSKFSF